MDKLRRQVIIIHDIGYAGCASWTTAPYLHTDACMIQEVMPDRYEFS